MTFADKYISTTYHTAHAEDTRTVLTDDAYALGEMIEFLAIRINVLIK